MAKNFNLPILLDANNSSQTFVNADGTAIKTIFTAGTEGSRVQSVSIVSDDTAPVVFNVYRNDGITDLQIGEITVPAGAGTDGTTPAVSLLNTTEFPFLLTDNNGNFYIELEGTPELITMAAQSAVTAAKTVTVNAFGKNY